MCGSNLIDNEYGFTVAQPGGGARRSALFSLLLEFYATLTENGIFRFWVY